MDGDSTSLNSKMSEERTCNAAKMRIIELSQPRVRDLSYTLKDFKDVFPTEKQKRIQAKINDLKLITAEDLQKEVAKRNDIIRKQNKKANKEIILNKLEKNIQRQTLTEIYRIVLKIVPELILNPVSVEKTALMKNLIYAVYRNICEINSYPPNLHYYNIYLNLARYLANSIKNIVDSVAAEAIAVPLSTAGKAIKRKPKCITKNCRRMCEIKSVAHQITAAKEQLLGPKNTCK